MYYSNGFGEDIDISGFKAKSAGEELTIEVEGQYQLMKFTKDGIMLYKIKSKSILPDGKPHYTILDNNDKTSLLWIRNVDYIEMKDMTVVPDYRVSFNTYEITKVNELT